MSLQSGRLGVRADQVNIYGKPISKEFFENLANDLPSWTDLPVWKSGTEQLLPVNDDEPETSPILCDINYPIADLKNNQYFTYRQSPTQKDGLAKIRGIRGKTLVWNQLNGQTYSSNMRATTSVSGTTVTVTENRTSASTTFGCRVSTAIPKDHKVYFSVNFKSQNVTDFSALDICFEDSTYALASANTDITAIGYHSGVLTATKDVLCTRIRTTGSSKTGTSDNFVIENFMLLDLTKMFGSGNEPTAEQFKALFPLLYYAYDTGSLLDFTGTKVKTSNRNLLPTQTVSNTTEVTVTADKGVYTLNGTTTAYRQIISTDIMYLHAGTYTLSRNASAENNRVSVQIRSSDGNTTYANVKGTPVTFTLTSYTAVKFRITVDNGASLTNYIVKPQLEFGSSATEFEPYTAQETELPTETFFPTGMKSAGAVYDELTPTRAITRVGAVDLGSLTWSVSGTTTSGVNRFASSVIDDIKKASSNSDVVNTTCALGIPVSPSNTYNKTDGVAVGTNGNIFVYLDAYNSYTNTQFKTAVTGVMLNYELATEIVQPTLSFD